MTVRWGIHTLNKKSIICLKRSIRSWKHLYPEGRHIICCNQIEKSQIEKAIKDIEVIQQEDYLNSLPFPFIGSLFKFCPPRLAIDDWEIFVDNDIIFHNKSKVFENFLLEDKPFVSRAHYPFWGQYNFIVKLTTPINSGFFGLPPHLDFLEKMKRIYKSYPWEYTDHCNDQGIIGSIFDESEINIFNISEIFPCNPDIFGKGNFATHLISLNKNENTFWQNFCSFL